MTLRLSIRRPLRTARAWLGVETTPADHREKLVSAAGGFVGILLVSLVSARVLGASAAASVIASMGASAVLLFALPHGTLSQPWPLIGGQVLSAAAGVACCRLIPDPRVAAPAAVGLAIGVMYYARCIHPPGGATALTAVLGGPAVHALGFRYVLAPVLLNGLILLAVAVAANAPFPRRRYPAALARRPRAARLPAAISHEHLSFALRQMGSMVDVAEDDLAEIYALATRHAAGTHLAPSEIRVGGCYTNGRDDLRWAIRQVVDELPSDAPENDVVLYWVLAGHDGRGTGTCTRTALALWAREEVSPADAATPIADRGPLAASRLG